MSVVLTDGMGGAVLFGDGEEVTAFSWYSFGAFDGAGCRLGRVLKGFQHLGCDVLLSEERRRCLLRGDIRFSTVDTVRFA